MALRRGILRGCVAALLSAVVGGCAPDVQPRVIADRVFAGEQLAVTITTYPGQPEGDIAVTHVSPGAGSDAFCASPVQPVRVENLPAVRIDILPAAGAERVIADLQVAYAERIYLVRVPFHRREVTIPADGGRVKRWVADSETVREIGSTRAASRAPG